MATLTLPVVATTIRGVPFPRVRAVPTSVATLFRLFVLSTCACVAVAQEQNPTDLSPEAALAELRSKRDDADIALIDRATSPGTRAAAEGLVAVYDTSSTLYLRRALVRSLCNLAESNEAAEVAVTKLANIAANEPTIELRDPAIAGLGRSAAFGKNLLKQLVDSKVDDAVRKQAIDQHRKLADASDNAWYRELWNLEGKQRKDDKGEIVAVELAEIRERAFRQLAPSLTEEELIEALRREPLSKIRRAALAAMRERKLPKTGEMATWILERVDFSGADRAEAARILIDDDGAKAVPTFLALAKKRDVTPEDLRFQMATMIADLRDDATEKKVSKLIGKGKEHEKVFALVASSRIKDGKVQAQIRKALTDKEEGVRRAAARVIGRNLDREALPDLREMLTKSKLPGDRAMAISAIGAIEQGGSKWLEELKTYAVDANQSIRNAALEQIANSKTKSLLPVLVTALDHADWSTRHIAVVGLQQLRISTAVPPLIERLGKETGRLSLDIEDALWHLTAQPWGRDSKAWTLWWEQAKADFRCVTDDEFDAAVRAKEQKRLKQRTVSGAKFFGIQVESTRVIFVIDVSGSMLESMFGRMVNDQRATRIDIAKQELSLAITNLQENAWFNILAFSSGVQPWREGEMPKGTKQDRDDAQVWVSRLGAAGGTNLYDSVKLAFTDQEVDTIFVMSDGEPTVGAEIDPFRIREDVAEWNKHRKVVIHTIAIGGNLEILEWIAKDSGGSHQHLR